MNGTYPAVIGSPEKCHCRKMTSSAQGEQGGGHFEALALAVK
jgi:hypothetical protein